MNYQTVEFDSVGDVIRTAVEFGRGDDAEKIDVRLREAPHSHNDNSAFYNGYSWPALVDAIQNPPAALLAAVDAMRERIGEAIIPQRRTRRVVNRLDAGDELAALAWAQRDPDGWTEVRAVARPRETLTIGVNLSIHFEQTSAELLYRGAAAAALSDVLESAGFNVEIVAFKVTNTLTDLVDRAITRVLVKPSDRPLDIGAVAFALCEVAFFRLALMSANARRVPGKLTRGWGRIDALTDLERRDIDILAEKDITTESAAVDWIRAHAAERGAA